MTTSSTKDDDELREILAASIREYPMHSPAEHMRGDYILTLDAALSAMRRVQALSQTHSGVEGKTAARGLEVTDEMVDRALEAFNKSINAPLTVKCARCEGKGYHHGFGEDGASPDWCQECGGNQYNILPGEEPRAIRAALEAALLPSKPKAVTPTLLQSSKLGETT